MTTFLAQKCKCSICGTISEFPLLMSTNAFGSPDLDLRPPEMERSTMRLWLQECPSCGYVAGTISEKSEVSRDFLNSEEYVSCDGINFVSELARIFYRHYLICSSSNTRDAFFALLHAAWACDDCDDDDNARRCRELAAPIAKSLMGAPRGLGENIGLIRADILRRSGQFDALIKEYSSVRYSNDVMNDVIRFELALAKKKDTTCYTINDAVKSK